MAYNFPAFTQLAMDNFQRADENPLSGGGNWRQPDSQGLLQLTSHVVEAAAINQYSASFFSGGIAWPNDQYSEVTILTLPDSGEFAGPLVRQADAAGSAGDTSYGAIAQGPLGPTANIFLVKRISSVQTVIAILPAILNSGDHLRIAVQGITLSVYINGKLVPGSVQTDSDIASGFPAMKTQPLNFVNVIQFGGWFGGSVTTPIIVTPNVNPSNVSLGSPLITPGWPLASAPAANPIASGPNNPTQTPDPNDAGQAARLTTALAQANETNSRLV
jgi:hypothetical protein